MRYHAKRLARLTEFVFIKEEGCYRRRGQQKWVTQRDFERVNRFGLFGLKLPQCGDQRAGARKGPITHSPGKMSEYWNFLESKYR